MPKKPGLQNGGVGAPSHSQAACTPPPGRTPCPSSSFCVWVGQRRVPPALCPSWLALQHARGKRVRVRRWGNQGPGMGRATVALHRCSLQRLWDPGRWGAWGANIGSRRGAGRVGKPDVTPSHFCSGVNGLLFSLVFLKVLPGGGGRGVGFLTWLCVLTSAMQIQLKNPQCPVSMRGRGPAEALQVAADRSHASLGPPSPRAGRRRQWMLRNQEVEAGCGSFTRCAKYRVF